MQGNSDIYVDFTHFKLGLSALDDTAQSPFGTARIMNNVYVTDKGSVAPRPGTQLLGTANASTKPTRGLFNFRRSFSQDEILLKAYDTVLEAYSKDNADLGWNQIMKGLTSDQVFGFVT